MPPAGGLWRHPDFARLWIGQAVSQLGSQITLLALPLTAVVVLRATPSQMGLLYAAQTAPFLLFGLVAGVWIDRLPRRPILIAADVGRALLLGCVPLAAVMGALGVELLYVVGLLAGVCTVFFDVAYQAFLPALVGRERLVEGNSKLEISRSLAQIGGPRLGGLLVQLVTPPTAIAVDAVSFLGSALAVALVRTREPAPEVAGRGLRAEVAEGLALVLGSPVLRAIAGCTSTSNFFGAALQALLVLYATRELGLPPGLLGVALAAGSVGALLGAIVAGPVSQRVGVGRAILGGICMGGLASVLIAACGGPPGVAAVLLAAAQALLGFGGVLYNVNQVSLRQAITPDRLLGRMNASMRFIVWGTLPLGALAGGALADGLGVRPTLVLVAGGALLTPLWVVLSPVRHLRQQPTPARA